MVSTCVNWFKFNHMGSRSSMTTDFSMSFVRGCVKNQDIVGLCCSCITDFLRLQSLVSCCISANYYFKVKVLNNDISWYNHHSTLWKLSKAISTTLRLERNAHRKVDQLPVPAGCIPNFLAVMILSDKLVPRRIKFFPALTKTHMDVGKNWRPRGPQMLV